MALAEEILAALDPDQRAVALRRADLSVLLRVQVLEKLAPSHIASLMP